MRIVGAEVLPHLIRPESCVQEGHEIHQTASQQTSRHTLASTADHVELSFRARDVQRFQQLVQDTPEIREARVVEVQRALSERLLPLDGHIVAPKLIFEAIGTTTHRPA
jgi:anti-sigma-28 factor FlgM